MTRYEKIDHLHQILKFKFSTKIVAPYIAKYNGMKNIDYT